MTDVKRLDVLVYPFGANDVSITLLNRWARLIEQRGKDSSSVFLIVHNDGFALNKLNSTQRDLVNSFFLRARVNMKGRFFVIKQRNVSKIGLEIFNKLGLKFAPRVKVNAFGNHAGNCVDKGVGEVIEKLRRSLPKVEFSSAILHKYSALSNRAHALEIMRTLAKHRPEFLRDSAAKDFIYFLADVGLTRRTVLKRLSHSKTLFDLNRPVKRLVAMKRKK